MSSVVFCADARLAAGGGHMSRCINLARALQPFCSVGFVLEKDAAAQWSSRLRDANIPVVDDDAHNRDAVAILDRYDLSAQDVFEWKRRSRAVVTIEDLGRRFEGVDLYVAFAGPAPSAARVLAGSRYALLSHDFGRPVTAPAEGGRILVTCGLRDSADLTGLYLDALARCEASMAKDVTVVLGSTAPHRVAIQQRAQSLGVRVLLDVREMRPLYDDADLILGAGGVSLFERMARGRASVTMIAADNQACAAAEMSKVGGTFLAGSVGEVSSEAIATAIKSLSVDGAGRARMAARAREVVDGQGANRVACEIVTLTAARSSVAATR